MKNDRYGIYQSTYLVQEEGGSEVRVDSEIPMTELMRTWADSHIQYILNTAIDMKGCTSKEGNWCYLLRICQEYRLIELASYLLDKLGIHRILRQLQINYLQSVSSLMGLAKRYCLLEAIRKAPIDKTSVELTVKCGTKEVVLTSPPGDGDIVRIQVTIHCEEDLEVANTSNETAPSKVVNIIDDCCGNQTILRRSARKKTGKSTPGLVNRHKTCFGICVLHTYAYLTQLYPELAKHHILEKLKDIKMDGKDKISNEISQSITRDITQLMVSGGVPSMKDKDGEVMKDKDGEVRLMNQSQDSGEFLLHLMEELERDGLHRIFQFELLNFSQHECSNSKCSRQPVRRPGITPLSSMYVLNLGCSNPEEVIDVATLLQLEMGVGEKVENTLNVNSSSELCSECQKPLSKLRTWSKFRTVPLVLVVNINRTYYDKRLNHSVKVNSHLLLDQEDGTSSTYQIGCIICHRGRGLSNGHYFAYIRNGEEWWLYDDSEVTKITNIADGVRGDEVVQCFYFPEGDDFDKLDEILIGTTALKKLNASLANRSKKRVTDELPPPTGKRLKPS